MLGKGIKSGICDTIHQYAADNKYMKDYNKNRDSSYFKYWDVNNLRGWAMSQRLTKGVFNWVENTSHFSKDFMKNYSEDNDEGYFLKIDVQYPEKLHNLHNDLPFLPERMRTENVEKFLAHFLDKKNMLYTYEV